MLCIFHVVFQTHSPLLSSSVWGPEVDLYGLHQKLWLGFAKRRRQQEIKERKGHKAWYWFFQLPLSGLAVSFF